MSGKRQEIRMGKVQHRIMQFLWEKGEATAREISDFVTETEPISHSTVQTLLRKLEKKGAVSHVERERIFLFTATANREDVTVSTTREFMDRVFQGSATSLVSHILEHEKISKDELQQLHEMIEDYREKSK